MMMPHHLRSNSYSFEIEGLGSKMGTSDPADPLEENIGKYMKTNCSPLKNNHLCDQF